jgi:glutaredoxin-dependent peroxiredoxin
VERIMEAARRAPSCANKQPARFIVCFSDEAREKGNRALTGGNYWATHAAFLVFAVTRDELDCRIADGRAYAQFDTGLAVENMLLQAVHEGMIGHPMAGFTPETVRKEFGVPEDYSPTAAIAFGYPGDGDYLNEKHREAEGMEQVRLPFEKTIFMDGWYEQS